MPAILYLHYSADAVMNSFVSEASHYNLRSGQPCRLSPHIHAMAMQ